MLIANKEQAILSKELASEYHHLWVGVGWGDIRLTCFYFSWIMLLGFFFMTCFNFFVQALLRSDLPHYMVPFSINDLEFKKPEVGVSYLLHPWAFGIFYWFDEICIDTGQRGEIYKSIDSDWCICGRFFTWSSY